MARAGVKYVKNELGAIHEVTEEHFEGLHSITPNGTKVLPAGWSEATEAQARKAHPQLFGAPDPTVRLNAREFSDQRALAKAQAEAEAEAAAFADDDKE